MANQYFNAAYYLAQNPDVAAAGYTLATAEQHYLKFGANENRAPNPYFNATQYLAQYPDLVIAGITKATALAHYAQFGLNEGRSPSATIIPNDFSYTTYAAANADLRTAFGITDTSNITPAQQHSLLAHFLSYGYVESRPGVTAVNGDSTFVNLVGGNTTFVVGLTAAAPTLLGTTGNDNFTAANAAAFGALAAPGGLINGLGGNDTLTIATLAADTVNVNLTSVENLVVSALTGPAVLNVGGSGLSSIAVNDLGALSSFTYNGAKVDSITLNGAGTSLGGAIANFTAASVTGTTDALKVTLGTGHIDTLTTNGIEQFNVAFGATTAATGLTLHANAATGGALSATLTGGAAGTTSTFLIDNAGSADLATITVNGAAVLGNQNVTVVANAPAAVSITTGAGADTLNASLGTDTLTGGAGIDTFNFGLLGANGLVHTSGSGATLVISGTDTITDFGTTDILASTGTVLADGAVASVNGTSLAGVVTFGSSYLVGKTLTNVINDLEAAVGGVAAGSNLVFKMGADTYFVHTAATLGATEVIKLTGVADITKLVADAAGAHFTA